MSTPAPKGYQREAVTNSLEIFRYAESQLRQAADTASRTAATASKETRRIRAGY